MLKMTKRRAHVGIGKKTPTPPKKAKLETSKYFDHAPKDWKEVYGKIETMRAKRDAPVDTMGCEECYAKCATEKERRFQILVSLLMSSQTNDKINSAAMVRLNETFKGLTPEKVVGSDEKTISGVINPVGFHKTKAKNMIKVAQICINEYGSDIPDTIEQLVALPGIGPKMGYLALQCAWGKNEGIGVDVHVHRICQRLNWTHKPKNPEETRLQLESWLPKEHWRDVNKMLVGFGQQICSKQKPKCGECLLNDTCPKNFSGEKKKN